MLTIITYYFLKIQKICKLINFSKKLSYIYFSLILHTYGRKLKCTKTPFYAFLPFLAFLFLINIKTLNISSVFLFHHTNNIRKVNIKYQFHFDSRSQNLTYEGEKSTLD